MRSYKASSGLLDNALVRPDFLIIGAQRCGTTSLYNYLVQHPYVARARTKEVQFFSTNFAKGFAWYSAQLTRKRNKSFVDEVYQRYRSALPFSSNGKTVYGEASPYYLFHPHAPHRIKKTTAKVKLIVLLRNPIDRAYSHYHHEFRNNRETLPFAQALDAEQSRLDGELRRMLDDEHYYSFNHQSYSYLSRGIYADQLKTWFNLFPSNQLLILDSDDLEKDAVTIYQRVLRFLGLPYHQLNAWRNHNQAAYTDMNKHIRKRLKNYFAPHNQRLYDLLHTKYNWDK